MFFSLAAVPDSPGKPELVDSDKTFIEIKWDKPKNDGGAPITGYDIERKEPKSNTWTKINKEPVKVRTVLAMHPAAAKIIW